LIYLGTVLREEQRLEEAIQAYRQALDIARNTGKRLAEAQALTTPNKVRLLGCRE
jgi:hypothetical protein